MGIVLYGMFLAIIVPVARKKKSVLTVVILAALCSILFKYVFTAVSSGFAIILCAVLASVVGAIFFPHSGGGANMSLILYIAIMAGVTYLIRVVPFTVFRKKIQNHFLQSFLYYIPLCGAECHDHSGNLFTPRAAW